MKHQSAKLQFSSLSTCRDQRIPTSQDKKKKFNSLFRTVKC